MAGLIAMIDSGTAVGWSVFGAVLAYLVMFILPTLAKQRNEEEKTGEPFQTVSRTRVIGIVLLFCALGAGVGAAKVLDPCSPGDAWICGLGSISFLGGVSNLGAVALPRP